MSYQDRTLTCADCSAQFVFTSNEQAFYADRGFTNEPKRCPACRQTRKSQRGGESSYSSGGGGGGYSAGGYGGGGGAGRSREMHVVTCSGCGGEAKVPFVPRGDRPVYCSDCFSQQRSSGGGGGGYGRSGGGGRY